MVKDYPLVCICIPTYNAAVTIQETLESILAQTYTNLVIHISDNASEDHTLELIESFSDERICIHRNDVNVGGEGNFNRCIQYAEGKYTAIFHADDIYEPDIVEKQVAFLELHPEAGAVFTEAKFIDDQGIRIGEFRLPKNIEADSGLYTFVPMFKAVLRYSNIFICPSVMVPTTIFQNEIKCWQGELFKSSADLDVWLRILQRHPVGYLPEQLIRYRIGKNQFSASVRLGTKRADFFLVADFYLEQEPIRAVLDDEDLRNYRVLDRRDRVMRAANLFILGESHIARPLVVDSFSREALQGGLHSKRGLLTLLTGIYLRLLIALDLQWIGKKTLSYMKHITHK